jgi:probable O-glycosylation ligase (exosortase A-associated)
LFTIALYIIILSIACVSLFKPWIGVVASYTLIILNPQSIWWWYFQDIRPVLLVAIPTFIGFFFQLLKGNIKYKILLNKKNFWLAVLWFCFVFSYFFGPYVHAYSNIRPFDPWWLLSVVNNIFILYFLSCLCIDEVKKLKFLVGVITLSTIYFIFWANDQYLFQGQFGRIGGPNAPGSSSIYRDENAFAMLFVTGLPFLYYLGYSFQNKLMRYGLWLAIPFGWHAIFLTGSRGGLLGMGVALLIICIRSKNKLIGLFILCAAIFAYQWQAGSVMKERALTINEYSTEGSAATRLEAWSAAIQMIKNHPITGVGITSFIPAFGYYSSYRPREAHNTFFQITAETGIFGGIAYIMIIFLMLSEMLRNSRYLMSHNHNSGSEALFLFLVNEAALASFAGMIVCSLFLSLHVYEIFYFLCLLVNCLSYLLRLHLHKLNFKILV